MSNIISLEELDNIIRRLRKATENKHNDLFKHGIREDKYNLGRLSAFDDLQMLLDRRKES